LIVGWEPSDGPVLILNAKDQYDRMNYSDRGQYDSHEGADAPEYPDRDGGSRSPCRHDSRQYNDRDREGYHSPGYNGSRTRSPSPYAAIPNRTLIFEGLPINITQEDVGHPILPPNRPSYISAVTQLMCHPVSVYDV